ncbi:uncharacterized protein N7484_001348 [Penicillium longicatenatum]|uniref:uncharacterized protein n=1 Tax=Penicillium longicatenatum TaxID=1561947 RepID=UPI0025486A40|nr:uncharacterized protein N7484_001348 [Penicillium longicatenatum]KAJ5657699.1 hypothetical protein N7484_001348 [Penicillium longicatenatum]
MSLIKWHNQWPDGIPSCVRRHEKPVENVESITCAWRRFVREQWVGGSDIDQQRRALIERWATADQEFRDDYERRARVDEPPFDGPENDPCLSGYLSFQLDEVYVCISQWTAETQALLAKCIISLFGLDCGDGPLASEISLLMPLEENQCDLIDNFKFRQSVARPDFQDVHMMQDGTVVFANDTPKLIIDDHTLETGLALWIQYETNGFRERVYRVQLLSKEFPDLFRDVHLNMNSLEVTLGFMEDADEDEDENSYMFWQEKPVDMRRPFLEVYGGADTKTSARLDEYAPGYRAAETLGNGLAIGYNLEQILLNDGHPTRIIES